MSVYVPVLREHRQKNFVTLSGFWPLRGWKGGGKGVWLNPLRKGNSWRKSFFQIMPNEALKICKKWYLLMENLIKITKNKRSSDCILQFVIRSSYLQNLKYSVKRTCIFLLILVGILSILILFVKNRGVEGFWLNGHNPLSVMKVTCRSPFVKSFEYFLHWKYLNKFVLNWASSTRNHNFEIR